MRYLKSLIVAFCFISSLVGAGLATGKEVALFLGNASLLSIVVCGLAIALFSYPFILIAIITKGKTLTLLFPTHKTTGSLIIKFMNFIFLSAMLGGAETLLREIWGFYGGSLCMALLTLISIELGNNFIKYLTTLTMPLILIALFVIFLKSPNKPLGEFTIAYPILYAGMNSANAGIFAGSFIKDSSKKDAPIISSIIFVVATLILVVIKSIIIGYEDTSIPLYYVSLDTNLAVFSVIVIFFSILTSCISSLKLCSHPNSTEPYVISIIALFISSFGFDKIVSYTYPLLGAVGIALLALAVYRLILLKLNLRKNRNLDL